MKLICDPSNGWMYGFPKEVPTQFLSEGGDSVAKDKWQDFKEWVITECDGKEFYTIRFWTMEG